MEVIPAIDLKSGRCVRLYQGDYSWETVYSHDPLAVALAWQEQGAARLHVVDLDGAVQGKPVNLEAIVSIVGHLRIPIQVGGGIRSQEVAASLLATGVDRVVMGTAAVEDPTLVQSLCQRYGSDRLVVAVDARDGQVAIKGWTETTSVGALALARQMAELGVCRLLYTDIGRDGTLTEPNFTAVAALVQDTGMAILASGGISSLEHLRRLAATGAAGAILGSALYTGRIKLAEAIAVAGSAGVG